MRIFWGFVLLFTVGLAQIVAAWQEPARGSPTRTALMDAIRPHVAWRFGAPVEFVVHDLRVSGTVAFASLHVQRPGGAEIDLRRTPGFVRGDVFPEDDNQTGLQVLYIQSGQTWVALHWYLGATDVWWSERELCQFWRPVIADVCQGL